jgi:hypothetical protein
MRWSNPCEERAASAKRAEPVDEPARGARQARVGQQHTEDQRDSDRDAAAGQQLSHRVSAKPASI